MSGYTALVKLIRDNQKREQEAVGWMADLLHNIKEDQQCPSGTFEVIDPKVDGARIKNVVVIPQHQMAVGAFRIKVADIPLVVQVSVREQGNKWYAAVNDGDFRDMSSDTPSRAQFFEDVTRSLNEQANAQTLSAWKPTL